MNILKNIYLNGVLNQYIIYIIGFLISYFFSIKIMKKVKVSDFLDDEDTEEYIQTCKEVKSVDFKYMFIINMFLLILCLIINKFLVLIPIIPILTTIVIIDIRMKGIPLSLNIYLFISNLIYMFISDIQLPLIFNVLCHSLFMYVVYILIILVTGAMGGGDAQLILALALLISVEQVPNLLTFPFIIGGIIAILLKVFFKKKKDYMFPFAPSIIFSIFFVLLI